MNNFRVTFRCRFKDYGIDVDASNVVAAMDRACVWFYLEHKDAVDSILEVAVTASRDSKFDLQ